MGNFFAVVRPGSRDSQRRVSALLESLGYELGHGMVLPAGIPDDQAAEWANELRPALLVLPYHLHRDPQGLPMDGVGVAERLGSHFEGRVPILMCVSSFSMESRLERRLDLLKEGRPEIWQNVVVFSRRELGSQRLTSRILRVAGKTASTSPSRQEMPTVRHGLGYGRTASGVMPRVPPLSGYQAPELKIEESSSPPEPKSSGYFVRADAEQAKKDDEEKKSGGEKK